MINGFRKEMMFFTRGGRMLAVILVTLGLALMSPVMFGFMSNMMEVMRDMSPSEEYTQMIDMFTNFSASDISMYNVEYVASMGAIVILFVFKGAAGGEQKLRSVIMPQCAGLSAVNYVLPKFLIYPFFVFCITTLSIYLGSAAALIFFAGPLDWGWITVSAVCSGMFLAFSTAVQLCVGISTGKSGLAIILCIAMQTFLPSILGMFRVDRFNPFALYTIGISSAMASGQSGNSLMAALEVSSSSGDLTTLNIAVSMGTAFVISILLYFVTVFVLHTKEVHNEGNEPVL
jgi:ABC-2 type transport system permease protein